MHGFPPAVFDMFATTVNTLVYNSAGLLRRVSTVHVHQRPQSTSAAVQLLCRVPGTAEVDVCDVW